MTNYYLFHTTIQQPNEVFDDFVYCVKKNAKHCNVKCYNEQYTVKDILIGDRIQLETSNEAIREEFLKHYGNLEDLLRKGRITESRIQAKLF